MTGKLDIRERKILILMNLWGIALLILSWFIFTRLANWIRPEHARLTLSFSIDNILTFMLNLLIFVLVAIVMMVVHEAFHGVCFWFFTRARPKFGFKGYYAYAAAPDWFLPKGQYLVTGLAPLIGITLICVVLMFFVPLSWISPLIWMLVLNTSGAVGDLWMVWLLLRSPKDVLARDIGDMIEFYAPAKTM